MGAYQTNSAGTWTAGEILSVFARDAEEGGRLLFLTYYRPLLLFVHAYFKGENDAEDIVQEVFYRFIRQRAYLRVAPSCLSSYLFQCVKHIGLNRIRDNRKFTTADMLNCEAVEEAAATISPEELQSIYSAIEALPEKTRLVVRSVLVRNMKYKEVADELGISVNTVKTLLATGLKHLRGQFSDLLLFLFWVERGRG